MGGHSSIGAVRVSFSCCRAPSFPFCLYLAGSLPAQRGRSSASVGVHMAGWLFCRFVFCLLQLEATSSALHWPVARAG